MIACYIFILSFIALLFHKAFSNILSFIALLFHKAFSNNKTAHNNNESSTLTKDIYDTIDKLNDIKKRIGIIDSLITDIQICTPNKLEKPITISWYNASGTQQTYDIWIDGNNANTSYLLAIANTEYTALCTALNNEIKNIKYRCNDNVTQTIIK